MWSYKTYGIFLAVISGMGTFTNFNSYNYINNSFDTNISVFNILAKDSLANGCCSALYFVTNIINLIDEDIMRNKIGCNIFCFGLLVPCMVGPCTSLMISLCRFLQLSHPTLFQINSKRANRNVSIVIGAVFIYCLAILSWCENEFTVLCQGGVEEAEIFMVSF